MKTLSNDITLAAAGTGMIDDYLITTIYENGVGVFYGRSYRPEAGELLYVNFNDFAVQNQSKDDFLKLNDDGTLITMPLISDRVGAYDTEYRFVRGHINTYRLHLRSGQTTSQSDPENVLCGYDYENKDIRPSFVINSSDSSLCRIMAGCDWVYNHSEEIGNFNNLLLPHYPYKETDKYGIGLQLWATGDQSSYSYLNIKYGLRMKTGKEVSLGCPVFGTSNQTFITLKDFIGTAKQDGYYEDYNSSVYLKQYGTSGDEFGDWEEGYEGYYGTLSLDSLTVYGDTVHSTITIGTFSSGADFNSYLQRYMEARGTSWNYNALVNGNRVVYTTGVKYWEVQVTIELNNEEQRYPLVGVDPEPSESEYMSIAIQPNFSQRTYYSEIPDKYTGTCPVAVLDKCYSRYYLAWNDRYGDIQSQPFEGVVEYSENIESAEILDYKQRRRVINKSIQPKWLLKSGWINEDVYPMYEAIYTSPYLLLYDTEQDKAWNVILTDSKYKEKTYKTEKKLINIELSVEANTKQQMIY